MGNVAVRVAFGEALAALGNDRPELVVLDADLASSTKVDIFAQRFPERFFQLGIQEQNMFGVAAGLAAVGFIPVVSTFAAFASRRACDQLAISIAYPRLGVKIAAAYGGLYTGKTGATHQALEDLAIVRAIPNMNVWVPADGREAEQMAAAALDIPGPVYVRLARDETPTVTPPGYTFRPGRAVLLKEGCDVGLISTGTMASTALSAATELERQGISAAVLHCPTLKPFPQEEVCRLAEVCGALVTVENHSVLGGLGGAVAEVVSQLWPVPVQRIGIKDSFGESGSNEDLAKKYGLTVTHVAEAARAAIGLKRH
ncbi:MAG: transketolase family protein [bacterium]|jgi:transketolase